LAAGLFWVLFLPIIAEIAGAEVLGPIMVISFLVWITAAPIIYGMTMAVSPNEEGEINYQVPGWKAALYSTILAGTGQILIGDKRWVKYLLLSLLFPPVTGLIIWGFYVLLYTGVIHITEPLTWFWFLMVYGFPSCNILFLFNIWDASWRTKRIIIPLLRKAC
jgi:hypothetical protein